MDADWLQRDGVGRLMIGTPSILALEAARCGIGLTVEAGITEIERKARFLDHARAAYRELAGKDIERVEDLVTGPFRVIENLPDPEPDAIPDPLRRGSFWEIEGDRIVSSYLGARYEVHYSHFGGHQGALYDEDAGLEPDAAEDTGYDHAEGEGA